MNDTFAAKLVRAQYFAAKHLRETGAPIDAAALRSIVERQKAWTAYDREVIADHFATRTKAAVGASDLSDAVTAATESFAAPDAYSSVIDVCIARGAAVVPESTRLMHNANIMTAGWPGEGGAIKVLKQDLQGSAIRRKKVGCISIATSEALEDASPETEAALQRELRTAGGNMVNVTALDWENAGTDSTPAALVYGVTEINSSGTPATDVQAGLRELSDLGSDLRNVLIIGHPRDAGAIATTLGSGGAPSYPGMSGAGGTLAGHAYIATRAVPSFGSPSSSSMILLDVDDVVITDGGTRIAVTDEGTLEMSDAPTGDATTPTAASASMVPMFQANCVAIRIVRRVNWALRHGRAVVISSVAY